MASQFHPILGHQGNANPQQTPQQPANLNQLTWPGTDRTPGHRDIVQVILQTHALKVSNRGRFGQVNWDPVIAIFVSRGFNLDNGSLAKRLQDEFSKRIKPILASNEHLVAIPAGASLEQQVALLAGLPFNNNAAAPPAPPAAQPAVGLSAEEDEEDETYDEGEEEEYEGMESESSDTSYPISRWAGTFDVKYGGMTQQQRSAEDAHLKRRQRWLKKREETLQQQQTEILEELRTLRRQAAKCAVRQNSLASVKYQLGEYTGNDDEDVEMEDANLVLSADSDDDSESEEN